MILSCADNSESFRLTDHCLRDFALTYSLMTDQITNLCVKNIMQASTWSFHHPHLPSAMSVWYSCVLMIPSSWSWWHSASFGRKWMKFALPLKAKVSTYGLFGRIVRRWSDGGMQPKLLLSFCSALLSPSMMTQFLCSGWKINCKIRTVSFWWLVFLILSVQCHRQGRKGKGDPTYFSYLFRFAANIQRSQLPCYPDGK